MIRKGLFLLYMLTLSLSMTVQAAEESKPAVTPLPTGIDMETIEDGGSAVFAAEFSISDFYVKETGEPAVRLDACDRELFDLVDISLLEEGDTIVLGGEDVTVETLERGEEGSVMINGGPGLDGGHILLTDEDTVYYEADADGNPYYFKVGELDLELDGDFVFTDDSGDEMAAMEYTWEDMLAYEQAGIQNLSFTAEDTVVTVENGFVTNITRTCSETERDIGTDIETDTELEAENSKIPYTIKVQRNALPVFEGPGYDYSCSAAIWNSGIYTVIQEEEDEEGNLWGKLKSGIGWVDLAEAISEEAAALPLTAVYANEEMLKEYNCVEYSATDSGQLVTLAFRSKEVLTDMQFSLLEYSEDGSWRSAEELYTLSDLKPETAFVAGVEFYGDMTAYGISFTDAAGDCRSFAVHISGRNGELLMDEYE